MTVAGQVLSNLAISFVLTTFWE